jgi:hypothetical protein
MEKVFYVHISGLPRPVGGLNAGLSQMGFRLGKIEKVIDPGRFVVVLENGERVTADGSRTLKIDNRVRVFPSPDGLQGVKGEKELLPPPLKENRALWTAFMPLGFGGKESSLRLQTFGEVKMRSGLEKIPRAVYFVIWTRTEKLGELQWSIYLKERQVSLQVFAEGGGREKEGLRNLAAGVERGLKRLGFVLVTPTVYLSRPFRVPEGFRLNVRG